MVRGGIFGCEIIKYPETRVLLCGLLRQGAVDPVDEKYQKKREEEIKLQSLEAWQRHLQANPAKAAWAEANPGLAMQARVKYNSENTSEPVKEPDSPAWLSSISGSIIETAAPGIGIEDLLAKYEERLVSVQFSNKGAIGIFWKCSTRWKEFNPDKCTIEGVVKGGPAYLGGIRKGDRLIMIDDFKVSELKTQEEMQGLFPAVAGEKVRVTLLRKKKVLTMELMAVSPSEFGEWSSGNR